MLANPSDGHRTRCGREWVTVESARDSTKPARNWPARLRLSKWGTGTENDLRRMRVVAVAAVIGAAALAYSLPRVRAQNSSTSNAVGTSATAAAPTVNALIVVANGISARALALGRGTSDSAAAAGAEDSQRPDIYFTAAQLPNRVMAIPASVPAGTNVG